MTFEVLMIEDNPGDVRLARELFYQADPTIHLSVASDGVDAMAFLRQQGSYAAAPRPDLILLDLNLPRMDGREVLGQIKLDESLKSIPTIILTSSEAHLDILTSYQLKANCYLSKPGRLEEFEALIWSIRDIWLTRAMLPPGDEMMEAEQEQQ